MNDTYNKSKLLAWKHLPFDFVRLTGSLPGLLWFRPRIFYENAAARKRIRGGALLMSNHVSWFDPVYLMFVVWYRRQRFICLKEFYEGRLRSLIFRAARCIPIDRENTSVDSLREIVASLRSGEAVTIFPEGKINEPGAAAVNGFKSGVVLMSVMSGRPIVPIYLQKKQHRLSRLTAVVGAPIDVAARYGRRPTGAQMDAAAAMLREKELELMKLCEERMKK